MLIGHPTLPALNQKSIVDELKHRGLYYHRSAESERGQALHQEGYEFRYARKLEGVVRNKREDILSRVFDPPEQWKVHFSELIQAFMCWQKVPEELRKLPRDHPKREAWRKQPENFAI